MTDKKLTDEEIIKTLECCLDISPSTCKNCPLFNITNSTMVCSKIATKFALDLINRLQAENKRLSILAELGNTRANDCRVMRDRALKAEAEVERLKKEKDEYAYLYEKHINTAFSHIKAEAYKECIGKVKEYIDTYEHLSCEECECVPISKDELDNLLKELVGDDNA